MLFCGEYTHPLDEKNRVVLPARLRDSIPPEKRVAGLYITRGFDGSLALYTADQWEVRAKQIRGLSPDRKSARWVRREFFGKSVHVVLDRQSRILLPESHRELAEVKKEVVFVGVGNHIELWAKEKYLEYGESSSASFDELAEQALSSTEVGGDAAPELDG